MAWLVVVGFGAWPILLYGGYVLGRRRRTEPVRADALPPGHSDGRFLVVLRTPKGARARQMFEHGILGANEALELWDGATCRGRKGSTEG